uniref:Uncharacterized protein n=1 Tax=Anopheles minimus TaxID=112268 RepID=A0A182WPV2_9DIPT
MVLHVGRLQQQVNAHFIPSEHRAMS